MLPSGGRTICVIEDMFPGLDLYYADPAQRITTAGEESDDLDHDLSELPVPGVKAWPGKQRAQISDAKKCDG